MVPLTIAHSLRANAGGANAANLVPTQVGNGAQQKPQIDRLQVNANAGRKDQKLWQAIATAWLRAARKEAA